MVINNTTITLSKLFYLVALILFIVTAFSIAPLTIFGLIFVAAGLLVG